MTSVYLIIKPNSAIPPFDKGVAKGNCVKIGVADDVEQRLSQLDCHAEKLEIIVEYEAETRDRAFEIESTFHNLLKDKNIRGEWFYLTPCEIRVLDNFIVEFFDVHVHYHNRQHIDRSQNIQEMAESCRVYGESPIYSKKRLLENNND